MTSTATRRNTYFINCNRNNFESLRKQKCSVVRMRQMHTHILRKSEIRVMIHVVVFSPDNQHTDDAATVLLTYSGTVPAMGRTHHWRLSLSLKRRNLLGYCCIRQLAKQWTRTKYSLCYDLSRTISPKDPNKCSELRRKLELLPSQKSVTCGPPLREVRCQLFIFLRFSDFFEDQ